MNVYVLFRDDDVYEVSEEIVAIYQDYHEAESRLVEEFQKELDERPNLDAAEIRLLLGRYRIEEHKAIPPASERRAGLDH